MNRVKCWCMVASLAVVAVLAASAVRGQGLPSRVAPAGHGAGLRFYAPFDEHARGVLLPQSVGMEASADFAPAEGKVSGGVVVAPGVGLEFPVALFLSKEEGSVAVWVKVNWDPAETATRMLINLGRFGSLRRWQPSST